MNDEVVLRWKGRIGSLKLLSLIVIVIALLLSILGIIRLSAALKNPGGYPTSVTLEQIVNDQVDNSTYIQVSGYAVYESLYEYVEDDTVKDVYYGIVDDIYGYVVLVKASDANLETRFDGYVQLIGMLHSTPSDLKRLVIEDRPEYEVNSLIITEKYYIMEGEAPPSPVNSGIILVFSLGVALIAIAPFFFPSIAFSFVPPVVGSADQELPIHRDIKATGRFIQIKSVQPNLIFGRRIRKFNNSVANVVRLSEDDVMIYIHHIQQTKLYGVITVGKHESRWAVRMNFRTVMKVEPGKVYGWKDRFAVRVQHKGWGKKPETLYITFGTAVEQAYFVRLMRTYRIRVGS
jgi:hypothetical protein